MLAKLQNGILQKAPKRLYYEDATVLNPTEEMLKEAGFKEVIETDRPIEDGFYFTSTYEEQDDQIVQVWTKHEIVPAPEPEDPIAVQIEKILTGRSL